jgi:hypothetical protein
MVTFKRHISIQRGGTRGVGDNIMKIVKPMESRTSLPHSTNSL